MNTQSQRWAPPSGLWTKFKLTLRMIKVQHTLFALPFALGSAFWASQNSIDFKFLGMIILAMLTARNTAMTFNRIVDRRFDKENPRTRNREIPSGQLSLSFAVGFCTLNAIAFIATSFYFNSLTFYLSPIALLIITGYSLTKRFTHYTQLALGFALGCAPLAAWIAKKGTLELPAICLGILVFFWVAGFDVIYSTLDHDYDKKHNLKNMVVKWGIKKSLLISKFFHFIASIFLVLGGYFQGVQGPYYFGATLIIALLIYEQSLVKAHDLSRVNMAFFTLNGYVSLLFLISVLVDKYVPAYF